jgi:hypothetical protein
MHAWPCALLWARLRANHYNSQSEMGLLRIQRVQMHAFNVSSPVNLC